MAFFAQMRVVVTTILMMAIAPSTAIAITSTATSGSYTLCQFYSSVPGLSSTHATSMTLPLCPSSLLTFSYTIPPETTTAPTWAPTDTSAAPSPSSTGSLTLCQFYSSIPGVSSQPATPVSSMTLPSCPASLQDITYSYQAPLATNLIPTTAADMSATGTAVAAVSSFTGAAAPRLGPDRVILGGAGAILAGAVRMMM